ncbi:hypothetical protein NFI96_019130 [Prochilodus magdalenae]|nr:hypothetical protein NFI96_019130 [Prochilodus magdalenae]
MESWDSTVCCAPILENLTGSSTSSGELSPTALREEQLRDYILETLRYVKTVKSFCHSEQQWSLQREAELRKMRDISSRADKVSGSYKKKRLEKKLRLVLQDTLEGLEKLHHFLDAVEKLAVTSPFVFIDEILLLKGVSNEAVRSVISAARTVTPLLIHFKRDDGTFFSPWLGNVDVLAFQLDKYIRITQQLCKIMSKSTLGVKNMKNNPSLKFRFKISGSMSNMVDHLCKIREDESFRMFFLFNGNAQRFIETYGGRRSRMRQFLLDLEDTAVKLDKMKKGARISAVVGNSVGIVGSILSTVGLALAPVTAGTSLTLTLIGAGLGVTSGVNSLVTGVTAMAVNKYHGKNANNIFKGFMKDMEKVLECIEQVDSQCPVPHLDEGNIALGARKMMIRVVTVGTRINALVDGASAVKNLRSEEVARAAFTMGLQEARAARNIPNLAADLPDIGQLAKGTPLAMSSTARSGLIYLNALFIGMDFLFICKESVSLAKKKKSKRSQLIRCRTALWRSELEAWDKILYCLCKEDKMFQENLEILQRVTISKGLTQKKLRCGKRTARRY